MGITSEKDIRYHELFEKLVSAMTDTDNYNVDIIFSIIAELCKMFRLSKAVIHIYQNLQDEKEDKGEEICCFDSGIEGKQIKEMRVMSNTMPITKVKVFMPYDAPPLSPFEEEKADLIMRTSINFVSQTRYNRIIEELTYKDDKGYPNLRDLERFLSKLIEKKELNGMAAIRYNLRHFSLVNQELGWEAGDQIIHNHYSKLLELSGEKGCIFRLGGDNFIAVCETRRIDEIITFLTEARIEYGNKKHVSVTTSAGILNLAFDCKIASIRDIMERTITAYRMAQNGEKGNVVRCDESIIRKKEKTMRIQQYFPEALRNEEFIVYYQPKVNISTGELCGAEALCRWSSHGDTISPSSFISVLEETSDVCKLDFYMLEHVCADIKRWLDMGLNVVRVSVNLSRKHMMNADLLDNLMKIINNYNIPHKYIEIELTETTTDVEFRDLKRVVGGLQQEGVRTSVDDFGMGYSSLNLIREIPWNVLKVDRSFLPLDDDEYDSTRSIMFRYVVAMAKNLGLECIAEGVETQTQLDILRENQCELAQGFLFDPPLPVEKFEERLSENVYPVYYSAEQ